MARLPAHSGQGFEEETPPLSVLRPTETRGSCLGAGWDGWSSHSPATWLREPWAIPAITIFIHLLRDYSVHLWEKQNPS